MNDGIAIVFIRGPLDGCMRLVPRDLTVIDVPIERKDFHVWWELATAGKGLDIAAMDKERYHVHRYVRVEAAGMLDPVVVHAGNVVFGKLVPGTIHGGATG
jgi:hypothetical protein